MGSGLGAGVIRKSGMAIGLYYFWMNVTIARFQIVSRQRTLYDHAGQLFQSGESALGSGKLALRVLICKYK